VIALPSGVQRWAPPKFACGAFFFELEYQQTGSYVFRIYRAAFGNSQPFPNPDSANPIEASKVPSYAVFVLDRAQVISGANLSQAQLDLANAFVQRPAFLARYPANLSSQNFIAALLQTIQTSVGVDLSSQASALTSLYNSGGRGAVLYRLADENATNPITNQTPGRRVQPSVRHDAILWPPPERCGHQWIVILAGPGKQRAAERSWQTARDGLFVHHVGGISKPHQPGADTFEW
jgi:hypothetical protein